MEQGAEEHHEEDDAETHKYEQMTEFNDKYHKRVLGSDRKCKSILYHVWPAVARNGVILGDQKIDVVLRKEMYT
eukprot:CAMPEP_0197041586 /NCGR_PEP_ID=MMETSP1384-20130603/18113_1 /TAXON_ID=29189 /ORGANISM="Ammonia sp." /LENGTH=73 /DNA_ID=CAMNT_0042472539 /DNA_START=53 /DNA_END=270 /DNA_ORIENTATION=-